MGNAISNLIDRVEGASGPDREIDAAIVAYFANASVRPYPPSDDFGPKDHWQFWSIDGNHFLGSEGKFPVPILTASLDAALALVREKLPDFNIELSVFVRVPAAMVRVAHPADPIGIVAQATTAPLAVLAALLRALQQERPRP